MLSGHIAGDLGRRLLVGDELHKGAIWIPKINAGSRPLGSVALDRTDLNRDPVLLEMSRSRPRSGLTTRNRGRCCRAGREAARPAYQLDARPMQIELRIAETIRISRAAFQDLRAHDVAGKRYSTAPSPKHEDHAMVQLDRQRHHRTQNFRRWTVLHRRNFRCFGRAKVDCGRLEIRADIRSLNCPPRRQSS